MENQTLETPKPQNLYAELINAPVEARTVLDEQDYQRRVYDINPNISVTFRGRDELPTVGSSEFNDGRPSVVLTPDELPHVVDQTEFSEYVSSHQDTDSENENLIVNATPVGIIDLAHRLSGEETMSEERIEMRANFLTGKIGDKENAILDMMATAFLDVKDGDPLAVSDGFMDVALALAGNAEKRSTIHEKAIILSTQERGLVARELGEDALVLIYEHEPLDPSTIEKTKGLVLVRTTDNEPKINEDGTVEMSPAGTVTRDLKGTSEQAENYIPRQTTHFSLNHFVRSHITGNFENRGYVVVAPLTSALEVGQRPANLFGVDTYFTTGPDESVKLPEARIIEAATEQEELIVDEGIRRLYKSNSYKPEDLARILDECENGIFKPLGISKYNMKNRVLEAARTSLMITGDGDLYESTPEEGLRVVGKVLSETEAESLDYDEIVNRIAGIKPEALDSFMTELVKDLLVDTTIIEQGGALVVPAGSSNYVETTGFDKKVGEIAKEIHSKSELHQESIEAPFEDSAIRKLHSELLVDDAGKHQWQASSTGQYLNEQISRSEISHRLRRAAIESGLSTVRDEKDKQYRDKEKVPEGLIV